MRQDRIDELTITPETYHLEHYRKVNWQNVRSEMADVERRFINGLIRYYRPENILEIGVCEGGGSVNILNAIGDMPASRLTSLDYADHCLNFPDKPNGFEVSEHLPDLPSQKWKLIQGKDFSEAAGRFEKSFDFCVIDSGHAHPVEVVNFLSILPFMADGGIVVVQDVKLYLIVDNLKAISAQLLRCSAVGNILTPESEYTFCNSHDDEENLPPGFLGEGQMNIYAIQITKDTRKFIGNVFEALMTPWTIKSIPKYWPDFENLVERYYSKANLQLVKKAALHAKAYIESNANTLSPHAKRVMESIPNLIFYGAGDNFKMHYLPRIKKYGADLSSLTVWDINCERISIKGVKIRPPDYTRAAKEGECILVTAASRSVYNEVKERFGALGYKISWGMSDID